MDKPGMLKRKQMKNLHLHFWKILIAGFLISFVFQITFAQDSDTLRNEILIDFEVRPRAEFRNNYILTPKDSSISEFYVSQRNRLNIYFRSRKLKAHASIQEIHLWGKSGDASSVGSINAFELYVEPYISKHLFLRVGRQGLSLDNGRLFSAAPWAQQGRSHEGIRLFFQKDKIATDLTFTFGRNYSTSFDPTYSPISANGYKSMLIHQFKIQMTDHLVLSSLNSTDRFENNNNPGTYYSRATSGGRIEYTKNSNYLTLNAHYQFGKNANQQNIRAFYLQPEISMIFSPVTLRLGAEILSGDNATSQDNYFRSFVPLYGVAWKFMGNMNLFTRFPADVKERGLLNPYLFVVCRVNKNLVLRADGNLFYSHHPLMGANNVKSSKYLGFENDLSLNYKTSKRIEVNFGFSYLIATESMALLGKVKDPNSIPVWSYLMVSYNPVLLNRKKYHSNN
jgi:hypothetical protein